MATIIHNSIYATLGKNLDYIKSGHGDIEKEDLQRVGRYIQGDHANILFARGIGCSKNPEVAAEQMLRDRLLYWEQKKGKKLPGQTEKKKEVLAEHFYISFHQCDKLTPAEAVDIVDEMFERAGLSDYRKLLAPHINTDELHVHASVCAYKKNGKRGKLNSKKALQYKLMATLDHICVERGLSIIENPKLLAKDPEYRKWFEEVKASGKVIIHPPKTKAQKTKDKNKSAEKKRTGKGKKKQKENLILTDEITQEYYEVINRKQEEEEDRKKKAQRYYEKNRYRCHGRNDRYYSVKLYDKNGRKRFLVELSFMLVGVAFFGMKIEEEKKNKQPDTVLIGKMDKKAQAIMDNIRMAREYDINSPDLIGDKLKRCGADMNALKKDDKYQLAILNDSNAPDEERRRAADALEDNSRVMKELKKEYHDLKHLQGAYVSCQRPEFANQFYTERPVPEKPTQKTETKPPVAMENAPEPKKKDINDLIADANKRAAQNANKTIKRHIEKERT